MFKSKYLYFSLILFLLVSLGLIGTTKLHAELGNLTHPCLQILTNYGTNSTELDQNQDGQVNLLDCLLANSPASPTPTGTVGTTASTFQIAYTQDSDPNDYNDPIIHLVDSDGTNPPRQLAYASSNQPVRARWVSFLVPEYPNTPPTLVFSERVGPDIFRTHYQISTIDVYGNDPKIIRPVAGRDDGQHYMQPHSGRFLGSIGITFVRKQSGSGNFPLDLLYTDKNGGSENLIKHFTATDNSPNCATCNWPRPQLSIDPIEFQGNKVVYASKTSTSALLDLYFLDNELNETLLTNTPSIEENEPSFTRDNNWVYYQATQNGTTHIMRIHASGGTATQIINGGSFGAYYPAVSGDNSTLVYYGEYQGQRGLIRANLDGTGKALIVAGNNITSLALDPVVTNVPPPPSLQAQFVPMLFKNATGSKVGAAATGALNQNWTTTIEYANASAQSATATFKFYSEKSGAVAATHVINLVPRASGSLSLNAIPSIPDGFRGSAVIQSTQPIVASIVQVSVAAGYPNPIYAALSNAQAGPSSYISTVLKNTADSNTLLAIQNIETNKTVNVQTKFYDLATGSHVSTVNSSLPPQSSVYIPVQDPNSNANLTDVFSGSAVITADGNIVSISQEMNKIDRRASAFEGLSGGGRTIYMASMLCKFGSLSQTTNYAVQNIDAQNTNVQVDFYDTTGKKLATTPDILIKAGNKSSFNPCDYGMRAGTVGSAVIRSSSANIIAVSKVGSPNTTPGVSNGETNGNTRLLAPYVRWSTDNNGYSSYITIMNVGNSNANSITATYYDANGVARNLVMATPSTPLQPKVKRNTTPTDVTSGGAFGYVPLGGSLEINSDQPVIMTVRNALNVNYGATKRFLEDYNGIPY